MFKFNSKFLHNYIERKVFESINSTQIYARENYEKLLKEKNQWYSIIAHKQTEGIGQYGRKWFSDDKSNLYFTLIIPYKNLSDNLNFKFLPFYTGYSLSKSIKQFNNNFNPKVKWINDILLGNKKIGGILIESIDMLNENKIVLIGVGINVNMPIDNLNKINQPATSLKVHLNSANDLDKIKLYDIIEENLCTDLNNFFYDKNILGKGNINELIPDTYMAFLNEKIKIVDKYNMNNTLIEGKFIGLDEMANCKIELKNGVGYVTISDGRMMLD
jgi:BirA family biotin operon repressor/biotin-[acetyl-CoA-carboxylase] ligase